MDQIKEKSLLRIVFLGNPEFARYHLEKLIENGYLVVGVVSAPDKPAGRGQKLHATPVTEYASAKNIPLLQPPNLKNLEFQQELASWKADLQIVIAFRMLPKEVWNMPPLGTLNLHASLLPQYRGAAPINWAIINGEKESGVSTFLLKHEIDTGDILIQKKCSIGDEETAGELHDKLMYLGAEAVLETLNGMVENNIIPIPQNENIPLKKASKIFSEDCFLDWNENGNTLFNKIRGLSPFPTARCIFEGKTLKIFRSEFVEDRNEKNEVGRFYSDGATFLKVGVSGGYLMLTDIQLEGKKRMDVKDFLRGYRFVGVG